MHVCVKTAFTFNLQVYEGVLTQSCEVVDAFPCGKFDNNNHHNNYHAQGEPKTSLVIMDV